MQRNGAPEADVLVVRTAIADCYEDLGRNEELLAMRRHIYERMVEIFGATDSSTLLDASRLADSLILEGRYREARSFCAKQTRVARRVLGSENQDTIELRVSYAISLYKDDGSRLAEALAILKDVHQTARRVFGHAHPVTTRIQEELSEARKHGADDATAAS